MAKRHSLNLLIFKTQESRYLKLSKKILPLIAGVSLFTFICVFIYSVFYVNTNSKEFNTLRNEVEMLEKKIADQKNTEGIYTLTLARLSVLSQILNQRKNFFTTFSEIESLKSGSIMIDRATIDKKGTVSLSLIASSSADLDNFVNLLLNKNTKNLYTDITAGGITREKNGSYKFTIDFKTNQALLK